MSTRVVDRRLPLDFPESPYEVFVRRRVPAPMKHAAWSTAAKTELICNGKRTNPLSDYDLYLRSREPIGCARTRGASTPPFHIGKSPSPGGSIRYRTASVHSDATDLSLSMLAVPRCLWRKTATALVGDFLGGSTTACCNASRVNGVHWHALHAAVRTPRRTAPRGFSV